MKLEVKEHKKRKQELGQFFTPKEVVEFVFDMLKVQLDAESDRWKGKYPSVIDPACGEGVFLKTAIEKKFTRPDWVFGVDIDENVVKKWKDINLLEAFGGDLDKLNAHFFHQNGLQPLSWEEHKQHYFRKLKQLDIKNQQFDLVVGNPPFGGDGLSEMPIDLEKSLLNYEIWKRATRSAGDKTNQKVALFEMFDKGEKERLKRYPVEILFVERFIQLSKSGGQIAIIIPDGILANSNLHHVRQYIAEYAKLNAIVSLPRDTFKNVGTSAKTSILFLSKNKMPVVNYDYPVFLASVQRLDCLTNICDIYKEAIKNGQIISNH